MAKNRTDEAIERMNAGLEPGTRADDVPDPLPTESEPEPVVVLSPAETWLKEAYEARDVVAKGEIYSADAIKRLWLSAIPVVEALAQSQTKPEARKH